MEGGGRKCPWSLEEWQGRGTESQGGVRRGGRCFGGEWRWGGGAMVRRRWNRWMRWRR